ncbi:protein alp1-like [Plakobranchus ocellatus]|uniref:Protein alp1-like n=1 Tax=Plakobranchus ocellatus TaxID=259542 RepID=A0AAV4D9K0_9GAST|nr:protein alp1-like [Plakobranchus ocellatus]
MVLLAMVDADYRFSYVNIGSYGKQSDGGIFSACSLGKALGINALNLPQDSSIDGANALGPMPYVIVADEAFPLQRHVMRPYPGASATPEIDAYNYRHSQARRVVENAFGILAERWRVFHTKISVKPETVEKVVMATTILHNMLQRQGGGVAEPGEMAESAQQAASLLPIPRVGNRGTDEALNIRANFARYFVENPLPWQENYIRRGLRN